jgi:alpha-N-acetylglucosaminidase
MRVLLLLLVGILAPTALSLSTDGIYDLVKRRLPQHADSFEFVLVNETDRDTTVNDQYVVSSTSDGKILVEGNSLSALSSGLVPTVILSDIY